MFVVVVVVLLFVFVLFCFVCLFFFYQLQRSAANAKPSFLDPIYDGLIDKSVFISAEEGEEGEEDSPLSYDKLIMPGKKEFDGKLCYGYGLVPEESGLLHQQVNSFASYTIQTC